MSAVSSGSHPIVGIDFDNTVVTYDHLIHRVAVDWGLIQPAVVMGKKYVRDQIRTLTQGEIAWQKLQAAVYGPMMGEARLFEGVPAFFQACSRRSVELYIISHKTRFAEYDETGTDLRQAATSWMTKNGFFNFGSDGLGLSPEHVFFEGTRHDKLRRISELGCTHYIDDLEEVFLEEAFPFGVRKILFDPYRNLPHLPGITVAGTWKEIADCLFQAIDFGRINKTELGDVP